MKATSALADHLDRLGLGTGPIELDPIGSGHSNLTFRLKRGAVTLVLRRPPLGDLAQSANDVLREARVLKALASTSIPVPWVIDTCEDPAVIGAPFFLMEEIDGVVVNDALPVHFGADAAGAIAESVVEHLVRIHGIEPDSAGFERLGRPDGYLERQVARFSTLLEQNTTRDLPLLERVGEWLASNRPESPPATFVHGDFRLGNIMFEPYRPAIAAVLDWEMATIGDPLADLGYLSAMWAGPDDDPNPMLALSPVTRDPRFPSRAELVARYEELSGRRADSLAWYQVLATWKSAIFLEGSYARFRAGASDDQFFATLESGVPAIASWAAGLAGLPLSTITDRERSTR
ncbi:MAG: phosphotransferase family protein [Actinomycetota bacterium]